MQMPDKRLLKPVIEFLILLGLGIVGVVEGLRLELHYRPKGVYDRIGAGNFLLGIGVALVVVACAYIVSELKNYRSMQGVQRLPEVDNGKPKTNAMIVTVGLTALNIFLMPFLGYMVPAVIFFVLNFTIFKLTKSQPLNIFLGVCFGIGFFLLFTHALGMFFPTGHFGLDFGVS